jgi:hypothetical protein
MHLGGWNHQQLNAIRRLTIIVKGEDRSELDCYSNRYTIKVVLMILKKATSLVEVDVYFQWRVSKDVNTEWRRDPAYRSDAPWIPTSEYGYFQHWSLNHKLKFTLWYAGDGQPGSRYTFENALKFRQWYVDSVIIV